jgi:hypothetical protein
MSAPEVSKFVKANAQEWSPDMVYTRELILKASSFQSYIDEQFPFGKDLKPMTTGKRTAESDVIEVGNFYLSRKTFPTHSWVIPGLFGFGEPRWIECCLPLLKAGKRYGHVRFDGPIHIPVLADKFDQPWMSVTPSEVLNMRSGVRKARGTVLVGGLGLGIIIRLLQAKKTVKSITVVERDEALIGLMKSFYPEVQLIHSDFYKYADAHIQNFDSVLVDIWDGYGDASYDREYVQIKKAHSRVWGWGDYKTQYSY